MLVLSTPSTQGTAGELSGLLAAQNSRNGYTVQDDGSINIPDVGRVRLVGLTVDEAEAILFQRLVENQIDPTFSLEIAEFNSRRVSVGGAVGQPGVQPITLTQLTLGEALSAAGSVSVSDIDKHPASQSSIFAFDHRWAFNKRDIREFSQRDMLPHWRWHKNIV